MNIPITKTVLDTCPSGSTARSTSTNVSKFIVSVVNSATSADITALGIVTIASDLGVLIESFDYCNQTFIITYKIGLSLETDVNRIFGPSSSFNLLVNCVRCSQAFTGFPTILTAYNKVYTLGSVSTQI